MEAAACILVSGGSSGGEIVAGFRTNTFGLDIAATGRPTSGGGVGLAQDKFFSS
jgi:hypothetical protein